MTRYKLTIEYDGRNFCGWQRQTNGPSVQETIEVAIRDFCGDSVILHVAGRTDSGVHAMGQVAHLDVEKDFPEETVRNALNFHLSKAHRPLDISILSAEKVSEDFHARFSATKRIYHYRISTRGAPLALENGKRWHVPSSLNIQAMQEAANCLIGHHDFTTFRAKHCQAKSPVKTLDQLDVEQSGDEILITASARSFLHHQVRNLVGTLRLVGEGKWSVADVKEALAQKDRAKGGPTAPAQGLYLLRVEY
ncbi:MAG: tRNA pseudouridine(38-40) synthase TruA [Alphaproteobacteria bacterium]|jgi:tRNA pseudouridine38-40 synthase|nr:tRNA pseudouridine(38-40) synthase TruA [Alphaproteobacteria bacterium]MBT5389440.1 tRNA pseudouridine(38-40) synthase TruA [Alphaproteobacteria bacterium]MBT5654994.1 tRNA pseudouridine(38-40) synthase TruA [Alphaproteobacteria bacterium]